MMPNSAETIEKLSRQLERQKILSKLNECITQEDYEKVRQELKVQCDND